MTSKVPSKRGRRKSNDSGLAALSHRRQALERDEKRATQLIGKLQTHQKEIASIQEELNGLGVMNAAPTRRRTQKKAKSKAQGRGKTTKKTKTRKNGRGGRREHPLWRVLTEHTKVGTQYGISNLLTVMTTAKYRTTANSPQVVINQAVRKMVKEGWMEKVERGQYKRITPPTPAMASPTPAMASPTPAMASPTPAKSFLSDSDKMQAGIAEDVSQDIQDVAESIGAG